MERDEIRLRLSDGEPSARTNLSRGDERSSTTRLAAPQPSFGGHSKDKGCVLLVWYEYFDDLQDARASEYRMKKWKRAWKLRLIEERNPDWNDLYETLF